MPKKLRTIHVEDMDWDQWKDRAREAGISLSEWIRATCNAEPPLNSPAKSTVRVGKALDVVTGELLTKVERKSNVPCCEHGIPKGYHCWQCRGMAVIK